MNIATSVHAISAYLLCFDEPRDIPIDIDQLMPPPMKVESEQSQCHEESVAERLDALRIEYEALSASYEEHKRNVDQSIESARREWVVQESDILAVKLINIFNASIEMLRADISRVLAPIVCREASQISAADLNDALRAAIAASEGPVIRIEGSRDLLEKVDEAIAKHDGPCEIVVNDCSDVTVTFPNARIETRLEDWKQIIEGLME